MSDPGATQPIPSEPSKAPTPAETPAPTAATTAPPSGARTATGPPVGSARVTTDDDRDAASPRKDPLAAVKDPDNRAKLLVALAAMALISLVLLVVVTINVTGDRFEQITVEGRPCVLQSGQEESVLYCQR